MKTHITKTTNTATGGFSTIELLIAFSVGIIFLTAAMMVSFSDPTLARQISLDSGQVAALDVALDNNALATSSNKLGNIVAKLTSNWKTAISGDSPNPTSPYTNTPDITDIAPCLKEISNATTWSTLGARGRQITFGTALGDMTTAKALGRGGCDPLPPSDWASPVDDPNAAINVSGADGGTDIAVRSFNGKRYAFTTSNPSGGGGPKKEFAVVDVSDNNILPSDEKGSIPKDKGLLGLVVVGNYAYALNNDPLNQLQVISLTNPEAPSKVGTPFALPVGNCNNGTNCQRIGRSIAYYNGYLYIGTGASQAGGTANKEFFIYCINDSSVVGCTATTPVFRGSLNIDHIIYDIAIKDNYAYLATSADYGELLVVNITSKTAPSLPSDYTTTPNINNQKYNALTVANAASGEDATSIYVLGKYAYLGRKAVNNSNKSDFYVLDISNSASVTKVGSARLMPLCSGNSCNNNNATYLSGAVAQGNTAFLSTYASNKSFYIVDITNPAAPTLRNSCSDDINTSQWSTALEFKDNQAYLVHSSGSVFLKIIYDNGNVCTP